MHPPIAIVMAAGKGTRMKSELPKVLIPVLGKPMIQHVVDALESAGIERIIVVVGYKAEDVRTELAGRSTVEFALQEEPLGTGHAVMACRAQIEEHDGPVLVVTGDSPLIQPSSVKKLLAEFDTSRPACVLGSGYKENPTGLGRIVRDTQGTFVTIVEEKDATPEQRLISEVNLSTYVFNDVDLLWALDQIKADNSQKEYYLTDCPKVLLKEGKDVRALDVLQPCEALTINTQEELTAAEEEMKKMQAVAA